LEKKELVLWYFNQNTWTNIDALCTVVSTMVVIISFMAFGKSICRNIVYFCKKKNYLFKKNYIIVFGLNDNNSVYIDSEIRDKNKKIIIVEEDKDNSLIEKYKKKGLLVEIGDSIDRNLLDNLKLKNAKHILISTENDLVNLEIAIKISELHKNAKLYINILDKNLRNFHKEQGIFESSFIKIYSYFEGASRDLFNEFDIDGDNDTIIKSNQSFSIAVIGNTNLAYEIISQACIMGQLPNENILTIYCIDKNINEFKQSIELKYPNINDIPTINLKYYALDINFKDFYENEIWYNNMTNVIICLEDEQKNLDIASNLAEITYINEIATNNLKTKILFAMFNHYNLTDKIKYNNKIFKNFYTFGDINKINDKNIIINETRDIQAKYVNFVYDNIKYELLDYDNYLFKDTSSIDITKSIKLNDEKWNKLSYFKQESNRAVADHFKTKLKYLGLKLKESDKEFKTLYKINSNIFNTYFTKEKELKLAKNEHQRWNAFHFLNGFKKIDFIDKKDKKRLKNYHELKKEHMCLIPFDEFKLKSKELQKKGYTKGEFEGYDFMINKYIPFIIASSGYEIILNKGIK
jgi:Trk K+ transport system NAD-binding subunit